MIGRLGITLGLGGLCLAGAFVLLQWMLPALVVPGAGSWAGRR